MAEKKDAEPEDDDYELDLEQFSKTSRKYEYGCMKKI